MFGSNCQFDNNPLRRVFYFADNCQKDNYHHTRYGRLKRPVNCGQFDHGRRFDQDRASLPCASACASVKMKLTHVRQCLRQWACQVQILACHTQDPGLA